ncbi:EF-hand domain-containing protein [Candidatus Thiothrix anitrata]|uniref:EF-hand domain-containing protein n=1 Tax=Candidatus Thiothrix anitrata TaxID=2823902 RepID=A0ABX7X6L1_9GAMM|nr:hypothetical protein [Candidatus Thiothrix anitrata]QTR50473.1 hypothetical protein J8380_02490 [Candidatus Thiothrix anitrata]
MLPKAVGSADWLEIAENQRYAVLRRGGLINLVALLRFGVVWVLLAVWLYVHADPLWLLLLANCSLLFALGLTRRYRLITDTPTSRLSSGAQGYVELHGRVSLPEGESSRGLPHLPATVWLPGYVEDAPFVLDDGLGRCLLYPGEAEIVIQPGHTHFSWLHAIYPGQALYVLGELYTQRAESLETLSKRERVAQVLAKWKSRPLELLHGFDANDNGKIDPDEWEQARAAAERQVADDEVDQRRKPAMHTMSSSGVGQLFLITNIPPERLARRYALAATVHTLLWLSLMVIAH